MMLGRVGVLNTNCSTTIDTKIDLQDQKFSIVPVLKGFPAIYGASCVLKLNGRYCGKCRCPTTLCAPVTIEGITVGSPVNP